MDTLAFQFGYARHRPGVLVSAPHSRVSSNANWPGEAGKTQAAEMAEHKFKIGETVFFHPSLPNDAPRGAYQIIRRLPASEGHFSTRSGVPMKIIGALRKNTS
jgi:hypothetical protein